MINYTACTKIPQPDLTGSLAFRQSQHPPLSNTEVPRPEADRDRVCCTASHRHVARARGRFSFGGYARARPFIGVIRDSGIVRVRAAAVDGIEA